MLNLRLTYGIWLAELELGGELSGLSSSSWWSLQRDNRKLEAFMRHRASTDASPRPRMRRRLWHFNKQISVICLSTSSLCSCSEHWVCLIYETLTQRCEPSNQIRLYIRFTISFILPPNTMWCQNRATEQRAEMCGGRSFLPDVYLHFTLTNEIPK